MGSSSLSTLLFTSFLWAACLPSPPPQPGCLSAWKRRDCFSSSSAQDQALRSHILFSHTRTHTHTHTKSSWCSCISQFLWTVLALTPFLRQRLRRGKTKLFPVFAILMLSIPTHPVPFPDASYASVLNLQNGGGESSSLIQFLYKSALLLLVYGHEENTSPHPKCTAAKSAKGSECWSQ